MRLGAARERTVWILLALLTLSGAALRLSGIGRLLPQLREPDAFIVYELQSIHGDPALIGGQNFHDRYPLLLARTLALLPYPEVPARADGADPERVHLAACARPFVVTRTAVALIACLLVPLTFVLARRFLGPGASLAAAFYVATSLLHVLYSGEARPHGAHATLALAAVLAALWASEKLSVVRVACALVLAVLAVSCLQLGLFVLPPLAVALYLGSSRTGGARTRARVALASAVTMGAALIGVLAFYPTLPYIDKQGIHTADAAGGGHSVPFEYLNALGAWRGARQVWMHDPLLAILALCAIILGAAWWMRERNRMAPERKRDLAVVAAYTLPYALVVSLNGEVYDRFLMPLLPYLACFAGGALVWLVARVRGELASPRTKAFVGAAIVVGCTAWPAYAAIQFTRVACAPDTIEQAADFLRAHVRAETGSQRPDVILTSPSIAPPLLYTSDAARADAHDPSGRVMPWVMYQSLLPESEGDAARYDIRSVPAVLALKSHDDELAVANQLLDDVAPDWVVLEVSRRMKNLPMMQGLLRAAQARGEIAFKSTGAAPAVLTLGQVDYQDIEDLSLRIVETEAFGPPVVIFRMRR
jgi:hypothetical protein